MGCEGGGVLSLCSPSTGAVVPAAATAAQLQQSSPGTWLAVVKGLPGAAAAATTAAAAAAEPGSSPPPEGGAGGSIAMVVLTWKGRSVTVAHHGIPPQPRPHVTPPPPPTSALVVNNKRGGGDTIPNCAYQGSSHNGGGEHSSSSSGSSSTDDKELGAFWELLDREIRPLPPLANSADSQQIFSDHKEMARAYLVMQQELFNLRKSKTDLEGKLSEAEQLEQMNNHRYQNKILELEGKRENLRNNHKRLRQQLEHIRSQTARGASHNHPPP